VGAIYLTVRDVPLPEISRIEGANKEAEPLQAASDGHAFTTTIKGYTYTLTPRATYDISGLVVSQHRGDALFNLYHRQIGEIHVGDQIRMTGLLVDYAVTKNGQEIFTRRTSLTRNDTGNGACEILYVTDLAVVATGHRLQADAGRYMWYTSLALFMALGFVWFVRPPVVE
jgi:hypothetical protein